MATTRARRIGRREAEELLSGTRAAADRDALVRLLDLAAAPPRPAELAGREATVEALVQTYRDAARAARIRRRSRLSLLSRAIAVKAFAGLLVLLLGGVAVAATTGNLPPPVQQGAHDLLSPLGVAVPDGKASHAPRNNGGTGHPSPTPSPTRSADPGADPSAGPGLWGLCQAWQAGPKNAPGRSMDSAAFQTLATAAGGADRVAAYCDAVLAGPHPPASPAPKGRSGKPSPPPKKRITATPTPSHPVRAPSHTAADPFR